MDIARPDFARKKRLRLMFYGAAIVIAVPALTIGVSRLKPAAPVVERSTVWLDTVHRGEMLRDVRGLGTLVPVDVRWIPAQSSARVDKIVLQSGATVKPDSIILELSDPQLQLDALNAQYAYKGDRISWTNVIEQCAHQSCQPECRDSAYQYPKQRELPSFS